MFDYLEATVSSASPGGVTMVLDKGMGLNALDDLLATAADHVQLIKFGWASSMLLDPELVREKIRRIRARDILVSPGGTSFEIAYARNAFDSFLEDARSLGFSCVEISDGSFEIPTEIKLDSIKKAKAKGFVVLSEVGKKTIEEDSRLGVDERVRSVKRELDAGSWKVVLEARESGFLGIFDASGQVRTDFTEDLVKDLAIDDLLFEAPNKNQQVWLMRRFGARVNVGNVRPEDAVSVASLRRGLRGDTTKDFLLQDVVHVHLTMGVPGAVEAARRNDVVVVIDSLRASSTIVTALATGMAAVVPSVSVDECLGAGKISAGERGGKKIPGMTHTNSPVEIRDSRYDGETLYLTTTNGTECIRTAENGAAAVLIGCLLNARAVAQAAWQIAREKGTSITLLTAGRNNQEALEDTISATEIAHYLDRCPVFGSVNPHYSQDPLGDFLSSEAGQVLIDLGCRNDVELCAQKDLYEVVPVLRDGRLVAYEASGGESG